MNKNKVGENNKKVCENKKVAENKQIKYKGKYKAKYTEYKNAYQFPNIFKFVSDIYEFLQKYKKVFIPNPTYIFEFMKHPRFTREIFRNEKIILEQLIYSILRYIDKPAKELLSYMNDKMCEESHIHKLHTDLEYFTDYMKKYKSMYKKYEKRLIEVIDIIIENYDNFNLKLSGNIIERPVEKTTENKSGKNTMNINLKKIDKPIENFYKIYNNISYTIEDNIFNERSIYKTKKNIPLYGQNILSENNNSPRQCVSPRQLSPASDTKINVIQSLLISDLNYGYKQTSPNSNSPNSNSPNSNSPRNPANSPNPRKSYTPNSMSPRNIPKSPLRNERIETRRKSLPNLDNIKTVFTNRKSTTPK